MSGNSHKLQSLKKSLFIFILSLSFLFLLNHNEIFPKEIKDYKKGYSQLIHIYKKWLQLEDEMFKRLTFRLSSAQLVTRGTCPKLTLEDNLGRKWVFKPSFNGRPEVAVVVYRIFKLFGLESPQIHYIILNINGKDVSGSIQRFIPNKGTLGKYPASQLSLDCLNYLIRTHVFYWLLANSDANPSNFLVLSVDKEGKAERIVRIDNDIGFVFSEQDLLKYDYVSPGNRSPLGIYYYLLWKAYMSGEIELDLKGNYAFIKFVENFPDSFFEKLILPVKTRDFEELSNFGFSQLKEKHADFLEFVISRKRILSKDFAEFYRDLAIARNNKSLRFPKNIDYSKIIAQISKNLIKSVKDLKREAQVIKEKKAEAHPSGIEAIVSFEGLKLISDMYRIYSVYKDKELIARCNDVLKQLSLLESSTTNKYEKIALKLYIEEIKKICSGEKPFFSFSEINKIVNPVPPKELE